MSGVIPATYVGKSKYNKHNAQNYQKRKWAKDAAEKKLVQRSLPLLKSGSRVLDVPCGGGRFFGEFDSRGWKIFGSDFSKSMLEIAKKKAVTESLDATLSWQDIEHLDYPAREFSLVFCFRLFHHFPNWQIRDRVVMEICRVSTEYVLLSYFHPHSVTSLKRRFRRWMGWKCDDKQHTGLARIEKSFNQEGFVLDKDFAQCHLINTLHLARFRRH